MFFFFSLAVSERESINSAFSVDLDELYERAVGLILLSFGECRSPDLVREHAPSLNSSYMLSLLSAVRGLNSDHRYALAPIYVFLNFSWLLHSIRYTDSPVLFSDYLHPFHIC
jgi:hypothetical protein